jgi:AcrR family transcriptional regulator
LRKVLASAEHVLVTEGLDNFTMAGVAEHAGVSIGAVYRRFSGKEQLLDAIKDRMLTQVEEQLAEAIRETAEQDIAAVIAAYTGILAAGFAENSKALPLLTQRTGSASVERARQSLDTMEGLFVKAASAHLGEVRHPDPGLALVVTARTIAGACIHRTATLSWQPDISWEAWQAEMTAMGIRYLTVPGATAYSGWPAISPDQLVIAGLAAGASQEPRLARRVDRGGAVMDPQPPHRGLQVGLDGLRAEPQPARDLQVARAKCGEPEHVKLTRCQAVSGPGQRLRLVIQPTAQLPVDAQQPGPESTVARLPDDVGQFV